MRFSRLALSLALGHSLLLAGTASAATFSGRVSTAAGLHVSGALVTLLSQDATRKQTVYSDAQGRFAIAVPFTGDLKLRVRTPFYEDALHEFAVTGDERIEQNIVLTQEKSAQSASDSLSSSAHAATLKFEDPLVRESFVNQCNYCHQIGNSLTRRPREKDAWAQTVDRMTGYMALLNDREKDSVIDMLSEGFQGKPVANVQSYEYSPELADAKVEEWLFGDGLAFPHDAEVGHDGKFYAFDEGHDLVWEIDPASGAVSQYPIPASEDLPVSGKFAGLQMPIGVFIGKHGPHSGAEDKDGKFWITNALSSTLASFDTKTKQFELFEVGGDSLYPHTVRIDQQGIVWFTLAVSNQVGRFDPKTREMQLIDLPSNGFVRWLVDGAFPYILKAAAWIAPQKNWPIVISPNHWAKQGKDIMNLPYGIDVNPKDGKIWYAKLLANKLGVIDPQTLEVREIDVPLSGPRRPRFDADGILWIPAFDHGAIMRFDPQTEEFKTYKMPTLAPNEWEAPYALGVNQKTGEVWITSNTSDRMFRFEPKREKFTAFPLPTRVTWMRDIAFTEDGKVCNSSSNLPAYAIEDGRPSMLCLDPSGGEKDREKRGAE